jgi:RND family efflux transporter MFP subunit
VRRAALVLALAACGTEPRTLSPPAAASRAVAVARAERGAWASPVEVVGTVRAVRSATLAPVVAGTVAEVRAGVGSAVRAGDVLVRLSAREVDARLEQARAVVALARLERDRAAALRHGEAIAPAQLDAALSQLQVASARQAEAETMAANTVLRAPFAGVVTAKLVSQGDTAMPGQPLLVLEAPGALRLEARVPEAAAAGLALGAPVAVRLEGVAAELTGVVGELDPTADAASRTRLVKVDLPAAPGVRSGGFGRLLLAAGAGDAVTVPAAALVRRGQLETVFVADAGVARLRLVRAGRERGGRVEIASGLGGDETVVVAEAAQLVDGQPITVRP